MSRLVLIALAGAGCMLNPDYDAGGGSTTGESGETSAGNGETGADDSADASTDATATAAEEGGPACGNGMIDGAEPCDDGNRIDGDGCNSDCVVSGSELWSDLRDGGRSGYDAAHELELLDDGGIAVAGNVERASTSSTEAELVRRDRDGNVVWIQTWVPGLAGAYAGGWGVVEMDDGAIATAIVVGHDAGELMALRVHDPDAPLRWSFETSAGGGFHVVADATGALWVTGQNELGSAALWHFDEGGSLLATYDDTTGTTPAGSVAWGMAFDGDDGVIVVGETTADPPRAFIHRVSTADGSVAWAQGFGARTSMLDAAYGAFVAPGGRVAVTGDYADGDGRRGWMTMHDAAGTALATIVQQEVAGNFHGVAVGPSGEVVVAGWIVEGEKRIAMVVKYDPGGRFLWQNTESRDTPDGFNAAWAVSIRDDGVVLVCGELDSIATGRDAWIVAYAP